MPCPSKVVTISLCNSDECLDCVNVLGFYFMQSRCCCEECEPWQSLNETVTLKLKCNAKTKKNTISRDYRINLFIKDTAITKVEQSEFRGAWELVDKQEWEYELLSILMKIWADSNVLIVHTLTKVHQSLQTKQLDTWKSPLVKIWAGSNLKRVTKSTEENIKVSRSVITSHRCF